MANPHYQPPCPGPLLSVAGGLGVEPLLAVGAAGGPGAPGAFGVEPLLQPRGNGLQQGAMVYPFLGAEGFG